MALNQTQREVALLIGKLVRETTTVEVIDLLDTTTVTNVAALTTYLGLVNELGTLWAKRASFPKLEFDNLAERRLAITTLAAYLAAINEGDEINGVP